MPTANEVREQYLLRQRLRNGADPEFTPDQDRQVEKAEGLIKPEGSSVESGIVAASYIISSGGQTYGDTTINLDNEDTQARLRFASQAFKGSDSKKLKPEERDSLLNDFVYLMHRQEAVGDYFPAVVALQNEKSNIIAQAEARVLEGVWDEIAEVRTQEYRVNDSVWDARPNGVLRPEQVKSMLTTTNDADMDVLHIKKKAAIQAIGDVSKVAEITTAVEQQFSKTRASGSISDETYEAALTSRLLTAAAEAKLDPEEIVRVKEIDREEKQLWDDKHSGPDRDRDFSDAIRNNRPDCSEYASFSAVAMEQAGIRNVRVMGHVLKEGSNYVGTHAYNALIENRDGVDYVVGVFEGTATEDPVRRVMNDVTLEAFESGQTLVTYNPKAGWQSYGTGKVELVEYECEGQQYSFHTIKGGMKELACNDSALIAEVKLDHIKAQTPDYLIGRLYETVQQYGSVSTGSIDVKLAQRIDPRLANALELIRDLPAPNDPNLTAEQAERYAQIAVLFSNDEFADDDLDQLGFTEQIIFDFEDRCLDVDLSKRLYALVNQMPEEKLAQFYDEKPWLREANQLMRGVKEYGDVMKDIKDGVGGGQDLENYRRLQSIVRNQNVSLDDVRDIAEQDPAVEIRSSHEIKMGIQVGAL